MENSQLFIFGEICQNHCTIVQGLLPDFRATLKIRKKIQF